MYRVCVQSSEPRNGISKIYCGEDTEYVRFESCTTTALGHSRGVFSGSLAFAAHHPKALLMSTLTAKQNTLPRLGISPRGRHLPESWEAQKDPLLRLGGYNLSVPVSRYALAMLPCTAWAGWWDLWRAQAVASLTGRVGSLLLGADPFLYFICALNWSGKKVPF